MEGRVEVFRFDPELDEAPLYETYEFPYQEGMTVLDVAFYIYEQLDGTFSFSYCCRNSHCGLCGAKINGRPGLMCREPATKELKLEPLDHLNVVRDLLIDREDYDHCKEGMRLFLDRVDKAEKIPEYIDPKEHMKFMVASRCVECYSCVSDCPVLEEMPHEFLGPATLVQLARHTFDPRDQLSREIIAYSGGLYNCTTCGRCDVVCPHNISPVRNIELIRERLVEKNLAPQAVKELQKIVDESKKAIQPSRGHSPYLEEKEELNKTGPVGLFIGCNIDYDFRMKKIAEEARLILEKTATEVVVPKEQVCCGTPLVEMGSTAKLRELVLENVKLFEGSGCKEVISLCGGCGSGMMKTWPEIFQEEKGEELPFEVRDFSQYFLETELMEKLGPVKKKIAYHQACSLHRGQGVEDEPQRILKAIPELVLIETTVDDNCCGGGGGLRLSNQDLSQKILNRKIRGLKEKGIESLVTGCPTCIKQLRHGLIRNKIRKVKVEHLVSIIAHALREEN